MQLIKDIFRNIFLTQRILRGLAVFIDTKIAELKAERKAVENKLDELIGLLEIKKVIKKKKVK